MKKHLLFNQSFGTEGSPNQTGETQTRENRIGLMSYLRRTLMLLFAVLTLSMANIGTAWGDTYESTPYATITATSDTLHLVTTKNTLLFRNISSKETLSTSAVLYGGAYQSSQQNKDYTINVGSNPTSRKMEAQPYWFVLYSPDAFVAGDSIVVGSGYNSSNNYWLKFMAASSSTYNTNLTGGSSLATPNATQWYKNVDYYYKLPANFTTSNYIAFQATGGTMYYKYIKFYHKAAAPSCATAPSDPTGFSAGTITSTGATFTITDDANTNNYEIYYSTSSTEPTGSTEATATTTDKSKAVTGLSSGTTYYAWVRAVCDASHKSDWVALSGSTFQTLATPTATFSNSTYVIGGSSLDLSTLFSSDSDGAVTYSVDSAGTTEASVATAAFSATTAGYAKVKAVQAADGAYDAITKYAYIQVGSNTMGSHTITYNLHVNVNSTALQHCVSVIPTSLYLAPSKTIGTNGSGGPLSSSQSVQTIETQKFYIDNSTSAYNSSNYVSYTFTVADGYTFEPTSVTVKFQSVSGLCNFHYELTDGVNTISKDFAATTSTGGTPEDAVWSGSGTTLSGTVTLKVFAYKQADAATAYRFGSPITITGTVASAASSCPDAWSFHSKNSSSEWRDPICMELDGDGDFYISEETAINVGDVSYKVGYQGADETKTTETDWQWMPMGPARNWTVGAHPTASNAGGALGYFYIHSTYIDNNRYIGFFPSSYMLRQGSGESWSNTTFNPASSAYGETVWTTPVQKFTASNAADYMYTALGTGNGGAVGCAMSTAMRPIYLKLHSDWKASSPKFYIYYFKNGTDKNGWSGLMQAVPGTGGDDLVGWIPEGDWDRVNCVRFNPSDAVASWDGNVWNCTYAITIDNEKNYYVLDAQGNGGAKDWYGHWDLYHNGFYRIWVDNASTNFALHYVPQYVLEYDNNGGNGSIDPQSVALDADPNTVTVKAATGFTAPEGKHFVNWNTAPGGGGTSYDPSDSYSLTADATLYAQWANNQYSVTHGGSNRGVTSGTTGANAATYGTDYTAVFSETTGYNLPATITVTIGGNTTTQGTEYTWDQGTGTVVVEGDYILGDVVITVNGVLKTYTVNFASNNVSYGTVSSSSISSVPHGSTVSINGSTNALTLNGSTITVSPTTSTAAYTYAFDHWSVDNGDEITGTTTITATFTRTAKTYDVDVTLTDSKATKKSGTTGSNAATFGTNHTLEFEAVSGYELPDDVTVIIGSDEVTKDVAYTWSVSEGVGTLQIGGSYILGNISITVTATSTCSTPADPDGLAAGSISSSGVTFTITDDANTNNYEIYYSTSSADPTGSTVASATTTSTTISVTGLTANTTYYAWVRAVCNDDYKSDWVALGTSTFKTLATGTKYYLFTPTKNAEPAHTGTLSGQFLCKTSDPSNNSQTIDGHSMSHWCKFSTLTSLSSGSYYFGKHYIVYDIKTNSTDFTLYFYNNASASKDIYYALVQEGITSAPTPVKVGTATAKSTGKATFTITASKNTRILFYTEDQSNMRCHQIVAEESGTALPKPGESGYKVGFKDTYSRFTDYSEGTSKQGTLDDSVKVVCYSNYGIGSDAALKLNSKGTDYISFRTGASACQVKVCVSSSKTYYLGTSKSATTNEQTSTHTFALAANTRYYINPNGSDVMVDSIVFLPAPAGYTVSITANPDGYGSVSSSSVTSVASGTTLSASTNTLSVGATDVTASVTSATAEYTYAFSNWTKSDGTALPSNVTSDLSVYANFTRSANSYTLTWDANGGSDGACTGSCTSGSTAYNTTLVAPTDPTLSNYTFDGWNTANDGSGSAAAATMPAANTTYYAAWKQTVTLTTGAQGSGDNQTPVVYLNGTSVSDFTAHTASGYTLQGYYTAGSGGTKVLNANGTFAAANVTDYITSSKWSRTDAAPTLYAQWVASEDCSTSDFVIRKGDATEYQGCMESSSYNGTATSFTAGSATTVGNAKMTISNYDGGIKRPGEGKTFSIVIEPVSGYYLKSICWAGKVEDDETVSYYWDDNSSSAITISPTTTSGTGVTYNAPSSTTKFTASYTDDGDGSGGIWWRNVQVEVCAAGGTTYSVTYNDNGKTGGSVPSDANTYSYGTSVTVKGNTGSLAKTNYTFAGWATNDDGTGSSYVADNTFSITANTTLYAKWTQSVTLDKNGGSTDGSATAVWNATGLTGITHAKPASGYKLLGYYSASSDGTKVLNSDGSFAATNVTDYITDGKWSRTSATTLYAEYESAGALTWNLIVNSDTTNLSTSTKTSAFTEISTSNMTNAALTGLTYSKGKKSSLTGKIEVLSSEDAAKYASVSFQVASGYKFIPSSAKVIIQPVETSNSDVKIILSDGTRTITQTKDNLAKGKKDTVTLTNSDADKYMMGTVTLKIYVYGASSETYRLGTPITIEGEIEEACGTMPSYTSMSYTTTTFAPNVDASGSPITIVGGENIDTYQWKYNKVNDRTSGTNCGTGTSLTPLTNAEAATDGTRYYWCEMTNEACDITIKSPAVAITVAAAKSDATVTWTDPASTPNYGGGGYTIKATVETGWDGNAADLVITAPAGIRIYNIESGTADSKKYVQASFDVTTAFDRETYSTTIPFTVSAAATATYNAISNDHNVSYSACAGAGEGSSYNILVRKAYTKGGPGNNYYYWDNTDGWISSPNPASSISSAKASSTMAMEFDSVSNTNAEAVYVRTYHDNIKKIRIYADFRANNMTVSNVYKHNDFYTANSKYEVDYSVVYNGDEENSDLGDAAQGYVDITLSDVMMSANDILLVKFNTSRVRPLGAVITESSAGSLNTYLQWSGSLADKATVDKNTTDAYFTYSASMITENTNSLGAITYSSSDPSVATVDATGKVAMVAAGTTTIKATLAASGCYKKAEISYTLNVTEEECAIAAGTLTLTSGLESKCSGDEVTLTLTGFESGASIQWKDGDTDIDNGGNYTIVEDGTTSTLTTNQPGTYSVIVTKGCLVRSNRITISNISATASVTKIVDEWYVKNGRLTPDIELWSLSEGATLKSVAWSPDNETGLSCVARGGVIYLEGKSPSSNESGNDIEYTLTATITDECNAVHEETTKTIKITHQKNTDKHVLAFVVTGTEKGGFTAGITAAQTTSVGLYNAIAAQFDVQATNVYATDDEKKLKEYYSQYDILCITDYPNTQTKGVNKKSYVDAIGSLIDIRPILTMEAFVSKLANWKAKGISGNPKSPSTRQYTMDLQCKDHEIFAGTYLTKVGEGDDAMYRVSMVCDTLEDYKTLDATYGGGAHAEKTDYNYGGKPALQGFTFTEDMADDLLPIGLIDDGAGNPLQVGIERQENMEARLMVLGINSYAMERLTDDGERVVINALNYLMKKNAEDIADCSTSFVGGAEGEEKNWNNKDNWTGNTVPLPSQKVRILAECEVSSTVHALDVLIVTDGKYNHGSDNAAGKLTIKENGALIVGGKIQAASAPAYNRPRATTPDKLLIETSDEHQAALIFDNEEGETQATVNLYSLGRKDGNYQYQYFAVPMEVVPVNPTFANETHGGTGIYTYVYNEATSGWERRKYYDDLFAFEGLGITTKSTGAMNYTMTGNLASTATKEITLTHDGAGLNLVGNSWMAPIQIGALAEDNTDANITQTAYIYCAGRDAVKGEATSGDTETAGQWLAVPFEAAEFETWKEAGKLSVIPAMQAFQIKVDAEATLTLDYDKVVRGSTNDLNAKLRAPGRRMAANEVTMTNIRVADSKTYTDLSLFEGDRFSEAFDNGWEAEYMNGDGRSAKLYAETEAGQMAVAAMYDYEGTVVGFAPGQETEYTFSFMGEDNGYYLNDIKLQNSVRISEGETYTFTYEEGDAANRFYISRTAINAPEVATGMENLDAAAPRVQKIIYNDKLYIIRGGRLYDATGKVVK